MGRIENLVKKFNVQTAVYWGNPVDDGKGGWTFDAPVEIKCRWEDKEELKEGFAGNRFSSQAEIMVNIDIDRQSYVFNGTLDELQAIATANGYSINSPRDFPKVFIVVQFTKEPGVKSTDDFFRQAFLFDQG